MENKKETIYIDPEVKKDLRKKAIDKNTTAGKLASEFIKEKLEEEGDLIE